MKSALRATLFLLLVSSATASVQVQGKESVAELRRLRALGGRALGGWNGGDNGRDHPDRYQPAAISTETAPGAEEIVEEAAVAVEATEAVPAMTTSLTSENLTQDEDTGYSCMGSLSKGAKIGLGVTVGVVTLMGLFACLFLGREDKRENRAGVHTAVPSKSMTAGGKDDEPEDLEEATAASDELSVSTGSATE